MDSKTIWIINQYASTPEAGMGGRHYHMARELAKQGHRVCLIAAGYTHLLRNLPEINQSYLLEHIEGFDFLWLKMPFYSDAHSKKRILNWILFSRKLCRLGTILEDKPDAVLCSSPSLISFLGAERLARRFDARLIFEVRDIWPLTFVELGGFSLSHPFIRFLQWIEDRAYRRSDRVVSNLKNSVDHMVSRGLDRKKFSWIPNGFSLDEVEQNQDLPESVLSRIPRDKFIIGYTGTIGVANALDTLIDVACRLENCPDIVFVLVGGGREKERLKKMVDKNRLENVIFIDPISKNQIQTMLSLFDVCFIGLTDDPLFRFGVSPNKLFDYFYAGKPVLYAINSGSYTPVSDAGAGLQIPAVDPQSMEKAVLQLYRMAEEDLKKLGDCGRSYVLENHEYSALAQKLAHILVGE